ncbi:hypothetical protein EV141_1117 [Microcella putealis]|uniref:Uncharacterized protein n=1 Tax=Microcella putealis TaxID=337005 RepID=A0A4Q7LR86_9MICO|nr:hypothetical protein [Microcella putealis]RZS57405.1 hypothetical protein EV141_1117 [Microcella putealis]TQM19452.1 hypothetical protein BJ957_2274 [Microcella putealis]
MRKFVAMVAAIVVVAVGLIATEKPDVGFAADARLFDPNYIISDPAFFDGQAMSEGEIQAFLQTRIGSCSNTNCLNILRVDTQSRAANAMCNAYQGAAQEPVSRIIFKVQQSCGISAKVLLVTLEKEQSLVSHRSPTTARLDRAMGYACPDNTAIPGYCDPAYGGVYNQLYWAAWQFKRYGNPPGTSNYFTWFPVGTPSRVQYHPNTACGSGVLTIQNKATAALYYYTPYQPNAAAMANLYGIGDSCSAYGNRNFWRLYSDWFGSPTGPSLSPVGNWELATADVRALTVRGWLLDPETADPITIHAYVNGQWAGEHRADVPRSDVASAYPAYGPNHGFLVSIPLEAQAVSVEVCLYGINVGLGNNVYLGCRTVTKPGGPPFGNIESAILTDTDAFISGWSIDPDTIDPVQINVTVNGQAQPAVRAELNRPDVGRAYPPYGNQHGFSIAVPLAVGSAEVCLTAVNAGRGSDTAMGCRVVARASGSPTGNFESTATSPGSVRVQGWVLDPDTADGVDVHAYVDGRWAGSHRADRARNDVARAFPAYGASRGFDIVLPISGGQSSVCLYGINVRIGANSLLGCRIVTTPSGSPFGNLESATRDGGRATIGGWAIDPDTVSPIDIHVYVDGAWGGSYRASGTRADVARVYPAYGAEHGFSVSLPVPPSAREICAYGINTGAGFNNLIGCRRLP